MTNRKLFFMIGICAIIIAFSGCLNKDTPQSLVVASEKQYTYDDSGNRYSYDDSGTYQLNPPATEKIYCTLCHTNIKSSSPHKQTDNDCLKCHMQDVNRVHSAKTVTPTAKTVKSTPLPTPIKTTPQTTFKELILADEKFDVFMKKYSTSAYAKIEYISTGIFGGNSKIFDKNGQEITGITIKEILQNPSSYDSIKNELLENRDEILKIKAKYQQFASDNTWASVGLPSVDEELFDKTIAEADEWYNFGDYPKTRSTIFLLGCSLIPPRIYGCPPYTKSVTYTFPSKPLIIKYSQQQDYYVVSGVLGKSLSLKSSLIVPKNDMGTQLSNSVNIGVEIHKLKQISDYPEIFLYRDDKNTSYTYYEVVKIRDGFIYRNFPNPNPLENIASSEIIEDYNKVEDALNVQLNTAALD